MPTGTEMTNQARKSKELLESVQVKYGNLVAIRQQHDNIIILKPSEEYPSD